jgi:signal transduction histidine kinase/ActR/RegA family two-component response regulator
MTPLGSAPLISVLHRRPKGLVLAFTGSVILVVSAVQGLSLLLRHERTIEAAELRATNLSYIVAEYVRGSFALADASLRQLALHGQHAGGSNAPAKAWQPLLAAAKAAMPGSGSLSVTDANGIIRLSTQPSIVGQSRADNYVFKKLAASDRDELVVDRPLLSPLAPRTFLLPIGRRLVTEDGRFDGAVVAVVMPEAFREFFRTIDVGNLGKISVFHPDGVVIFREPSDTAAIGQSAARDPILQAAQRGRQSGVLRGPLESGGPPYVTAFQQRIGTPPLVVAVSLSESEVLQDWSQQIRISVALLVLLALTILFMLRVLFRQIDARGRVEKELTDVQQLEAERLRDTNQRLAEGLEREQRARRESEAASYLKDEFLMTLSHELRTPLTAIYGWARMLTLEGLPEKQRARALQSIERNARVQTRLIDDLLDVSRAITGKLRLDARPVRIAEAVRAAIDTIGPALEAKGITFTADVDPNPDPVIVDPDRVQQIVWNLLSNAIKFTPEGGRVELVLKRHQSTFEIVVSDTGVGIDPDFLPFVFDRFRQADGGSRRRYGGLGLGLAIVRHLTELHGGTATAESAGLGMGATFRIQMPVRAPRSDKPASQVRSDAGAPKRESVRLDGIRVLVVDDEEDARELFGSIVEAAGAIVQTASSAEEAMEVLARGGVQVLLSDIEMPAQDGYGLLKHARANGTTTPFVAIAITAYAHSSDRRRALDAGFDCHLPKPVEPAELVSVIASLITTQARST